MPVFSRFLRYFVAVGRLGSIRKAADELNVSASAIDRQILNAEAQFGMPLFERLPSGLRLTAAGEALMATSGRWQKSLAELRMQIQDLQGLKRGHVDIAIIDALVRGTVPAVIQSVQAQYPGITIGLHVMDSEAIRSAITRGDVDFGIGFEPESIRDLTVRAFADVALGFVTLPGHRLAQTAAARFSACEGEPVIMPVPPLAVHLQVGVLEAATQMPLRRTASSNNIRAIIGMVQQGIGVGLLTSLDVATDVAAGELAFTRITDPILKPMTLALCTATSRTTSYAADVVLNQIQNVFGQFGYGESESVQT